MDTIRRRAAESEEKSDDNAVIRNEPSSYRRPSHKIAKNIYNNNNIDNSSNLLLDNYPDEHHHHMKSDLRGDWPSIILLYALYVLQGIPLGLIAAVPMLLQNHGASYKQQAEFSFANWPFSMKLLWAPIVDSLYVRRFGRRKSWLVPSQYLLGFFMLYLSRHIDGWLGAGLDGDMPNLPLLTMLFFMLNFLAATQDIAVDGWALTMLKPCNVGYASTANSVGQTTGYFLGYVLFMALESKEFCNNYLRTIPKDEGIVTLSSFLFFWGIVFLAVTTLVALFKHESSMQHDGNMEKSLNLFNSYRVLLDMIKLPPIRILAAILLTVKVSFAACDSVTSLKLIEAGVPKEKMALLVIPLVPMQIFLPLYLSRYTSGPRPMDVYVNSIPYRIIFACIATGIVYVTPLIITQADGSISIPLWYYGILLINYAIYQVFLFGMFVAVMAFFAKISDPAVGGTYMTFLNTLANLGGNWPGTVILWFVEVLTWKRCIDQDTKESLTAYTCNNHNEEKACAAHNGACEVYVNGYYMESLLCGIYGVLWLLLLRKWIHYLQELPISAWRIPRNTSGDWYQPLDNRTERTKGKKFIDYRSPTGLPHNITVSIV